MNDAKPSSDAGVAPCRRRYPDDFKRDAIRLVTEEKYSFKAAAEAVGVSEKSLRDWHAKLVPPPVPCADNATLAQLQQENKRLRKQLAVHAADRCLPVSAS